VQKDVPPRGITYVLGYETWPFASGSRMLSGHVPSGESAHGWHPQRRVRVQNVGGGVVIGHALQSAGHTNVMLMSPMGGTFWIVPHNCGVARSHCGGCAHCVGGTVGADVGALVGVVVVIGHALQSAGHTNVMYFT
jgi:hypothetical protein